jgi:hypothetical protein
MPRSSVPGFTSRPRTKATVDLFLAYCHLDEGYASGLGDTRLAGARFALVVVSLGSLRLSYARLTSQPRGHLPGGKALGQAAQERRGASRASGLLRLRASARGVGSAAFVSTWMAP